MGKDQKQIKHPVMKSKYFKWGLTAFTVLMASVLSIYIILNMTVIGKSISKLLKMIMPVVDGFVVAYLLSPLIDILENKIIFPFCKKRNIDIEGKRKGTIRGISIFFSLLVVFLLIYMFIRSVVPQVIKSIQNIIVQMPVYLESLINIANTLIEKLGLFPNQDIVSVIENYYEDIMSFVQENIVPKMNGWVKSLSSSVFGFFGALWDLLIGFFIAVYLLSGKERFRAQTKKLIYSIFKRERANLIIEDIRYVDKTFISFFAGKIIDSIIVGMLCFIILTLFNMPYTLLISVIIGLTNIIPFFGPFIGAIPSGILILLIDPIKALYFVVIVVILQQFDGNLLGPMILGNSTGLSGFWIIFSITFFGGVFGIPGVFLGVPTFACIYAWIKRFMRGSLTEKELSTDTDDYLNLDYIDEKNVIHSKDKKQKLLESNEKHYTQINLYEKTDEEQNGSTNVNSDDPSTVNSVKDSIVKVYNGISDGIKNKISELKKETESEEIVLKNNDSQVITRDNDSYIEYEEVNDEDSDKQ